MKTKYNVDENGFYGQFGGAFIPEMLYPNVEELKNNYLDITSEPSFKAEFDELLKQYVGRPTPLYFAKRLSKKYNTKIYLKREDLCHTGAHKINNTIGQILVAKKLGKTRIIAETGAGHAKDTPRVRSEGDLHGNCRTGWRAETAHIDAYGRACVVHGDGIRVV